MERTATPQASTVSRLAQAAGDCQYTATSPSCRVDRDATTCKQMLPVGRPIGPQTNVRWGLIKSPDACACRLTTAVPRRRRLPIHTPSLRLLRQVGFEFASSGQLGCFDAVDRRLIQELLGPEATVPRTRFQPVVATIGHEFPRVLIVLKVGGQDLDELTLAGRVLDGREELDASIQGPGHPIGAGNKDGVLATMAKMQDACMLEGSIDDAHDGNVFAQASDGGLQTTDSANIQPYRNTRLAGPVQGLDDLGIDQRIELGINKRFLTLESALGLLFDQRDELLAKPQRGGF